MKSAWQKARQRVHQASGYWLAFTMVFGFLVIRSYERILKPVIWAEDGNWLSGVLNEGFLYIFYPYAGYMLTVEKFILWFSSQFPCGWWPWLINVIYLIVYAALIANFGRSTYDWILPSKFHRILFCGFFAFAPGLHEMVGNTANLPWALCFFPALVYLKKPDDYPEPWEVFLALTCMMGAGQTVILLPALMYRLALLYRSGKLSQVGYRRYLFLFLAQTILVGLNFKFTGTGQYLQPSRANFSILSTAWRYGVSNYVIAQPILGFHWTLILSRAARPLFCLGSYAAVLRWSHLFLKATPWKRLPYVLVLSWTGAIVLSCMVRGWGREIYGLKYIDVTLWEPRIGFVLMPAGLLFWTLLISGSKFPQSSRLRFIFPAFMVWYSLMSVSNSFKIGTIQKSDWNWASKAKDLEQAIKTGCPRKLIIPIEPTGWTIRYESPKEIDCGD